MYLLRASSLFFKKSRDFWPKLTGKGKMFSNEHGMFKKKTNVNRHGPRPLLTIAILPNPLVFHSTLR
jgi:hypothetical protein